MKKVLIIADLHHASPRIPSLCKFFPELDWEPIVLTGHPVESVDQTFRTIITPFPDRIMEWKKRLRMDPQEGVRKQLGIPFNTRYRRKALSTIAVHSVKGFITYPDAHYKWKRYALRAANQLLKKESVNAIISSSSPVTSHMIARAISTKWRLPWIADLRDLWTQNHNYHYGPIRRFFEQHLELCTLKTAQAMVTVSPLWAEDLRKLHKRDEVHSITNGFDPELLQEDKNNLTSKFSITYTGPVYTGKHDTDQFLSTLKYLLDRKVLNRKDLEIRFYGHQNELLQNQIDQYMLNDVVKQFGLIPRKEAVEKQRESQLLLLFYWNDSGVKGWYPLKVFEYLASGRPMIVTGGTGGDVVEKLVNQTGGGIYCRSRMEMVQTLSKFYLEYKEKGAVANSAMRKDQIDRYNYKNAAKSFAAILNTAVADKEG